MTKDKQLQRIIDKYRAEGVVIEVKHDDPSTSPEGGYVETTIRIDEDSKGCWDARAELQGTVKCDSGYGFGSIDLQLLKLYDIK